MKRILTICVLSIWALTASAQFYTGSNMSFGRKRVQYETFFWSYYRFENFDTYFSRNGKPMALYTASFVQNHLSQIEAKIGQTLDDHLQFIIFNRLTDYKQSNIGYVEEDNYNSGGITKLQGNKIFLFFKGDYVDFERQIREGITEVLVKRLLYGNSISSQIKNNVVLEVPEWFEYGMISYLATPWNTQRDDNIRDAMRSKKYNYLATLEGEDAKEAGHSLFRFIAETYGESAVIRILRVTSSQRKVESALKYALNISYKDLIKRWEDFYLAETALDEDAQDPDLTKAIKRVRQKDRIHYQFKLHPDGDKVAYISNEKGRARVHIRDLKTGKHKVVMKIGYALNDNPDYTYPALTWHPSGDMLVVAAEKKGLTNLFLYNIKDRKTDWINIEQFEKVLSIDYSHNGRLLAMSAVRHGQSDIYLFNMGTRVMTEITKDIYDDANPRFIKGSEQLIFSSNRPSDTLQRNERFPKAPLLNPNHNIFIYDLNKNSTELLRVTDDSLSHFSYPVEYDANTFSFLSDKSGVNNRSIAVLDSVVASVDTAIHYRYVTDYRNVTNSSRNIQEQDINPVTRELAELIHFNNKDRLLRDETERPSALETVELKETKFRQKEAEQRKKLLEEQKAEEIRAIVDSIAGQKKRRIRQSTWNDVVETMIDDFMVNLEKEKAQHDSLMALDNAGATYEIEQEPEQDPQEIRQGLRSRFISLLGLDKRTDSIFPTTSPKQNLYHVEYSINDLTTQISFSFLNSSYQTFTGGNSPIYLNPGTNGFLKIGASDLMENHRLIGGYRFSFDFSNNEYLLSYENLENRTGKQYVFHRQALSETTTTGIYKLLTHNVYYVLKHPLNEVLLLKGTLFGRMDKVVIKSVDDATLREPDHNRFWAGLKGELVYDHTRSIAKNINVGARSKLFAEYYQSLTEKETSMFVLGADYRHYLRIWRTLIWANRVAGSTSFGKAKLIYYMGGVDDWLFPKFNASMVVDQDRNYAYQTLATNMRGFTQNIRNGNSFVAMNSELRFPVLSCLSSRPINAAWLRNFQLIGFFDAGTAWVGVNPWSKENALYRDVTQSGNLTVTIEKQMSAFVAGFGWGIRTELFGYFLRLDRGYGIENGKVHKPIWHFSFGFDF